MLIFVSTGMNDNFWSSFFPTEAAELRLSESTIGLIASSYDLSGLISSVAVLFLDTSNMRKFFFSTGCALIGVGCVVFGQLPNLYSGSGFVAMCVLTRSFMGVGSTFVWCCGTPLAISMFPTHTGRLCSGIELSASIGFIFGPPLGSWLFDMGGYSLPFWVVGLLQVILALVFLLSAPELNCSDGYSEMNQKQFLSSQSLSATDFILHPGVLCISVASLMMSSALGYMNVAFGPHLKRQFTINGEDAGSYFLPFFVLRAAITPLYGYLIDKGFAGLIFWLFGSLQSALGFLLLGLPSFVAVLRPLWAVEVSTGLVGMGSAAGYVPLVFLFTRSVEHGYGVKFPKIHDYSATTCNLCYSLGLIIGQSWLGGTIFEQFGFYDSCLLHALLLFISGLFGLFYFIQRGFLFKVPFVETDLVNINGSHCRLLDLDIDASKVSV